MTVEEFRTKVDKVVSDYEEKKSPSWMSPDRIRSMLLKFVSRSRSVMEPDSAIFYFYLTMMMYVGQYTRGWIGDDFDFDGEMIRELGVR